MRREEILKRLDIIRNAIELNDKATLKLQVEFLKDAQEREIKEIVDLLKSNNVRQALYLIKKYQKEYGDVDIEKFRSEDETEIVLNVEDMLRMSPIAKETIREFKSSLYTKDDLEAFAKNIKVSEAEEEELSLEKELERLKEYDEEEKVQKIEQKESKTSKKEVEEEIKRKAEEAIEKANKETPLDEMTIRESKNNKRTKILSSYKTLRAKFAKKETHSKINEKDEPVSAKIKRSLEVSQSSKKNEIYPPIPHIEDKFRQAFILYPPLKESDIWIEEIVVALKKIANESYSEKDIEKLFEEYSFYLEKGDIARASQFLLLAASTDSRYAQFILARELFKGKVLKRDIKASFELMRKLANKGYPDAVCDLAQFYEYGVGVAQDKKIALKLYEKAFEMGVSRATRHINRIKESSSLLASIKKIFTI